MSLHPSWREEIPFPIEYGSYEVYVPSIGDVKTRKSLYWNPSCESILVLFPGFRLYGFSYFLAEEETVQLEKEFSYSDEDQKLLDLILSHWEDYIKTQRDRLMNTGKAQ